MARAADEVLARAAVGGDGAAFAELYDRHERRAFNLAYRICGTREDAADATQEAFAKVLARLPRMAGRKLDFGAYLLTAVRHACYDVIASAGRAQPAGELPPAAQPVGAAPTPPEDDPDRRMLLAAQQEEIRAANATLPPRQREVLALRELENRSYDEIAALMGMNRNSVAQLISRARIGLRDALRRTALGSIAPATPACERALALVALRDDGEHAADGWLDEHLAGCETCALAREAMAEAGASYRAWATIPALEGLRRAAAAHAGERLGHDWDGPPRHGPLRALLSRRRRRRRDALIAGAGAAVLLLVLLAPRAQDGTVDAQPIAEPQAAAPARAAALPAATRARPARPARRSSTTAAPAARRLAARPQRSTAPSAPAVPIARAAAPARVGGAPAAAVATPAPAAAVTPAASPPAGSDVAPGAPTAPPPLPAPPPPPPPRSTVTSVVAPAPPPPPTRPRRLAPRPSSGGSTGVPAP